MADAAQPRAGSFVFLEFDEGVSAGVVVREESRHLEVVLPEGPRRVRVDRIVRIGSGRADLDQDNATLARLAGDYLRQAEALALRFLYFVCVEFSTETVSGILYATAPLRPPRPPARRRHYWRRHYWRRHCWTPLRSAAVGRRARR